MAKGLTWRQIYDKTPESRILLAPQVAVRSLKFGMSKSLKVPKAIAQTWSREKGKDDRPKLFKYTTAIEFHPEGKVKVACSCPDYLYRWEYALYRKGSGYLLYSNGEKPQSTNPRMVPGACKHLVKVMSELRKQRLLPKY